MNPFDAYTVTTTWTGRGHVVMTETSCARAYDLAQIAANRPEVTHVQVTNWAGTILATWDEDGRRYDRTPGMNDIQPCPSDGRRMYHRAHGQLCRKCGVDTRVKYPEAAA